MSSQDGLTFAGAAKAATSPTGITIMQPTATKPANNNTYSSEILAMLRGNGTPLSTMSSNEKLMNDALNEAEWKRGLTGEQSGKEQEVYGIKGLLDIIKMGDQDVTTLSLGTDLPSLGLDLNSTDNLYETFFSPWSDSRNSLDFLIPSCYNVQPPAAITSKLQNFSDETLFYIFYSMPKDKMQDMAAQELYNRNWKYHKELKIWLTRDATQELIAETPAFEKGVFIFFDVLGWEKVKKEFLLVYDQVEERAMQSKQ